MHALLLPLLLCIGEVPTANPDIAVVCPNEFLTAMQPWLTRRAKQGHVMQIVPNLGTADTIRDEIRALTTFRTMNLLDPFSFPAKFDIVFCRNVAIYFSEQDKVKVFRSISKVLAPDGYLIIGSTESITGLCPEFEPKRYLRAVFYQFKAA